MNTKELIDAVKNEKGSAFQNCRDCEYGTHNDEVIEKLKRLAELEDKSEQGTLIELPFITQDARGCWRVHFYSKRFNTIDCYVCYDREEAEKRLKELQE